MKPIYLVIQAFGPFAGRHVVDFRRALDCGLFGIYGSTGSGKSSVFNAMTFALFGEAVKEKVDNATLRSHHASVDLLTQVEFVFEIGGRQYRVVRSPDQQRPAKRGSGLTGDAHKAWLFDVTGKDPALLNEQNPGSLIAEKNVQKVTHAIEGLLGYKADQFRQIVLLPQGRFEMFLSADTPQRLQILRELFDVSLYRAITEEMKRRAAEAEEQVRMERKVCESLLENEGFSGMDALTAKIEEVRVTLALKKEALDAGKALMAGTFAALQTATQQDKSFQDYSIAITRLNDLKARADDIVLKRERLAGARKAGTLVPLYDQVRQEEKAVAYLTGVVVQARQSRSMAETHVQTTGKTYTDLVLRASEFEQKRFHERDLLSYRDTLLGTQADRDELARASVALDAASMALETSTQEVSRARENVQKSEKALEAERVNQVQRAELKAKIATLKAERDAARTWEQKSKERATAQTELVRKIVSFDEASQALSAAKAALNDAEAALFLNHAALLAGRLVEGEPCLVCGSLHHPVPAKEVTENQNVEVARKKAQQSFQLAQENYNRASVARDTTQARHEQTARELAELKEPTQTSAELQEALQSAEKSLGNLGVERDLAALRVALTSAQTAAARADTNVETARQSREMAETRKALAQQKLNQALSSIPAELRTQDALDRAIIAVRQAIQQYDAAVKAAEAAKSIAAAALIKADRDATNADSNLKQAQSRLSAAQTAFDEACAKSGLSQEAYSAFKPHIPSIEILEAEIRQYEAGMAVASENVRKAEEATKGLNRPDIDALKKAHEQAEQQHTLTDDAWHAARQMLETREKLQKDVTSRLQRLEKLEAGSAPVRELARYMTGKDGAKVDLETFAIGAIFDRVLEAANARMRPMTANRYTFVREAETKGGARKGLGLSVEDIYTGRTRPTSSLSGGETFIAALALALGLSDVVESNNGNIRLDTIFIDEGFGSLDTTNEAGTLDRVLTALHSLAGQTRAVGVISHVPLVRQHIPSGFEIIPAPNGSTIEERL